MTNKKSKKKPPRRLVISEPEHVRLLTSVVRDAILQTVLNQPGVSIREIADQIGAKASSLYRHIDALVEAGLIEESGAKKTTKRDATTYTADGEIALLTRDLEDQESVDAMQALVQARARYAGKTTSHAMGIEEAVTTGPSRDTLMVDVIAWLDDEELTEMNTLLARMMEITSGGAKREGTKLIAFTAMLRPLMPRED